jgi:hypothetical protein
MVKQQPAQPIQTVLDPQKLIAATEAVTAVLRSLTLEERRRVIKAIVILFDLNINFD